MFLHPKRLATRDELRCQSELACRDAAPGINLTSDVPARDAVPGINLTLGVPARDAVPGINLTSDVPARDAVLGIDFRRANIAKITATVSVRVGENP